MLSIKTRVAKSSVLAEKAYQHQKARKEQTKWARAPPLDPRLKPGPMLVASGDLMALGRPVASSAPGRPKPIELQAVRPRRPALRNYAFSPHRHAPRNTSPRRRAVDLHASAPSPTSTRAEYLAGLQIVRLRAIARRRAEDPAALRALIHTGCVEEIATRPRAYSPGRCVRRNTSP